MSSERVGALTIGQGPRPDLVAPLRERLPAADIVEVGALDDVSAADVFEGAGGRSPLQTRLRNGSTVMVDEEFLSPLLEQALRRLESEDGVVATCLLCAGAFPSLTGTKPLIKPFAVGRAVLRALGLGRIGVLCPFAAQKASCIAKWSAAGFDPVVSVTDSTPLNGVGVSVVVLDFVGYTREQTALLQEECSRPVLDLGAAALDLTASLLSP